MTRRLALDIHFDSEERSLIYDYYRHFKSLGLTAKFCTFLAQRKNDRYNFSRAAIRAWLESRHEDVYTSIKTERLEELARRKELRKASKVLEKPRTYTPEEIADAFRRGD